jgi:hypothetical protein
MCMARISGIGLALRSHRGLTGARRHEVWQAHALGLAPVDVVAGVVCLPEAPFLCLVPKFRNGLKLRVHSATVPYDAWCVRKSL